MSYSAAKQLPQVEDPYPSRGSLSARVLDRQDPVVYSSGSSPPINAGLIEQYREEGYLILDGIFNEEEVSRMKQEVNRLRQSQQIKDSGETISEPDSGEVRSVFRVHAISSVFKRLVADKRLAALAEYILGDQVYIHQSRVNFKPGFRGREFYWHSDFETWHVEDGMPAMRALSMSINLTENYPTNGPLMVIPKSHNKYVVCEGETPDKHFKKSLKRQSFGIPDDDNLRELANEHGIVATTGKPGSVILFDCNLLHGSSSNITPFPRSNAFIVYNAMANRVTEPFCQQPPRPEYICSREHINPVTPGISAGSYGKE